MSRLVVSILADTPEVDEIASTSVRLYRLPAGDPTAWTAIADGATHAIVIGEPRHELAVRHHAALAADLGLAVARRTVPAGPLGLLATARRAVRAATTADGGLAVGLVPARLDEAAAAAWFGAWVPRVTRLDHPAPGLGQHLRSWLPVREGFLVTLGAQPGVSGVARATRGARRRAARAEAASTTRGGDSPAPAREVLTASGALPDAAGRLALAAAGAASVDVGTGADGDAALAAARFGAGAVELVALPTASAHAPAGPLITCPACAAKVPRGFCPYCRVRPSAVVDDPPGPATGRGPNPDLAPDHPVGAPA